MTKKRILCIADTHFPYHHRDTFAFLKAIKDEYDINEVCHVGDVNDNHFPSYHEKESDCLGGAEEIHASRLACQRLEKIFPEMKIALGNHDLLPKRKAASANVPLDWVSEPNTVYELNGGWDWASSHYISYGDNLKFLLVHSIGINLKTNSTRYSHSSVQGHHHSTFGINYVADTDTLRWAMGVGCLIDPKSPAFMYDKKNIVSRPILGSGVVIEGTPHVIPMTLNKSGGWNRTL